MSRYLSDKCFDIVLGYQPPQESPNGPHKKQFFEWLSADVQKENILTWLEKATSLKTLQNDTPKINFFVCRKLES